MRSIRRAGLVLFALVIASCSGGEGGEVVPAPGEETAASSSGDGSEGSIEDLESAATAHFEAFLTRDDETYFDLLSTACRDRLGFAAVGGHLDGRHFTAGLDGVEMSALSVSDVVVEGGGSSATVLLVIDGPSGDQFREAGFAHTWIHEDGGWHMDDCADFQEAQGGLEGVGMDRSEPLGLGGVTDVNDWLIALMYVSPDDEAMVVETGGQPAADGNQLLVAQLNVGYNGGESSVVFGEHLAFAMVNGDSVYGEESNCIDPDNDLYVDPATAVGPGEDIGFSFVCREVPAGHIPGMLLRITHIPSGGEWWYRLDGT